MIPLCPLSEIGSIAAEQQVLAAWWGDAGLARVALSEHQEQSLVIDWCHGHLVLDPRLKLIFAIPNGLWAKNKSVAAKAVAEGLKKGVPDLLLPIASQGFYGLFIEMKKSTNSSTSAAQKQWHKDLRKQGYRCEVCKGREQAIAVIVDYLGLEHIEAKIVESNPDQASSNATIKSPQNQRRKTARGRHHLLA
jgi:VRR-NUC domain